MALCHIEKMLAIIITSNIHIGSINSISWLWQTFALIVHIGLNESIVEKRNIYNKIRFRKILNQLPFKKQLLLNTY